MPDTPVPQVDRTTLQSCSSVQLVPFVTSSNGSSNNARRRATRPQQLSGTVPEPRHKSILFSLENVADPAVEQPSMLIANGAERVTSLRIPCGSGTQFDVTR